MEFNEKMHAFLAARYYQRLTGVFGERGKQAFIHATQYYGEQRGRRMAQRAIRDGQALTYHTYMQYGEWVNTEEITAAGCANQAQVQAFQPDYVLKVTRCPWHQQFKEMGLPEAGSVYCAHLDNSICRGFNPYIVYQVPQTLHTTDCCLHIVRDAGLTSNQRPAKKPEYLHPFSYHCAHSYWAYRSVVTAIFGMEGEELSLQVLQDFADAYGQERADTLLSYRNTDFNLCD